MQTQFVEKSSNAKIGGIPCTSTERASCPSACKLAGLGGCYGDSGFYTRLNWNKIDAKERGESWTNAMEKIQALPAGQLWRHNVVGDLPHNAQRIDRTKLRQLIQANQGKSGFTYTHHSMRNKWNRDSVHKANLGGFTVNLSADDPAQADKLASLGIGPVVCIVPENQLQNTTTPQGRKIVICPAETHKSVTCKTCALCANPSRQAIIGFPAHGSRKNRIAINQMGVKS